MGNLKVKKSAFLFRTIKGENLHTLKWAMHTSLIISNYFSDLYVIVPLSNISMKPECLNKYCLSHREIQWCETLTPSFPAAPSFKKKFSLEGGYTQIILLSMAQYCQYCNQPDNSPDQHHPFQGSRCLIMVYFLTSNVK